jgi:hypothetical protein
MHTGAAATLGCASAVASLEVPDCEIHFIVAAWVEVNQWGTGTATPSSRRRVDGARAVKFDFRTGRRLREHD